MSIGTVFSKGFNKIEVPNTRFLLKIARGGDDTHKDGQYQSSVAFEESSDNLDINNVTYFGRSISNIEYVNATLQNSVYSFEGNNRI